ncbi:hypothetical protein [Burkholderia ubonensis]|uniref:hypothetical protein n=1 Tax=Burkholderia ubonensis TaxID=101571 RepID=UPI002AAF507F|nr:hypothetical protein [Burkholderia ubonensis]
MNTAKTIKETIEAVCVASPLYRGNRMRRALAGWAMVVVIGAIIYLCWSHGWEVLRGLGALISWKDEPVIPAVRWFVFLILCLFVAAIVYEAATASETRAAVHDGKATDDLLVAIAQNPHIPQSAKASLAREIEEHGHVSAEALGQIAVRAEREAIVKKRRAEIQRAQLGPGAAAMLNYRQADEQTQRVDVA